MPEMTMADYSAIIALSEENKRLRQRVAELEAIRNADDKERDNLLEKLEQRGERMKALHIAAEYSDVDGIFEKWFDPETGEPL